MSSQSANRDIMDSFEESQMGQMAMLKARELFELCDSESKGFIIKRDMQRLINELPDLSPDQLEEVFDSLDQDHNGFLTMEEFTKGFGVFLGLSIPEEIDGEESEDANEAAYSLADEIASATHGVMPKQSDDLDEEHFQQLMDNVGASEVLKEQGIIKDLWSRLRKDDPALLNNFENFLASISTELQKTQEDFSALESALELRSNVHDDEVRKLYDEMEGQIGQEKDRILNEERQRAQKEREELEQLLLERDAQMQELMSKHQELERKVSHIREVKTVTEQENEALQREREQIAEEKAKLEKYLEDTREKLDETTGQLDDIKKRTREEKRARAKQALKVTEGIATERENLVKQLDMLREGDPSLQRRAPSPLGNLNEPSIEESECEVDDSFIAGSLAVSQNVPRMRGGRPSLMHELSSAMEGQFDPRKHPRGEPVGSSHGRSHSIQSNSSIDCANPERVYKVVVVGDSGVGKTCFLHRYCHNRFKPTFSATIGVDFQVKTLMVDGRVVALQLWDTAGQERFRSITKQYFRKADGVLLMYDVTSELSFINLRNWVQSVQEGVDENCCLALIGNKVDLYDTEESRVLKFKDGQRLADEFGALFFEASAQTGEGVSEAMMSIASVLYEREDSDLEKALTLSELDTKKKRGCCGGKK